ncbi:unnamed protein product [Arabidopsis arenosa]|uniref:Uncharacterized protein n=1 Tax=Arabidopsis arenosa TaxID=38785 RepID=A0A8S2BAP5_ARAAE|nr:unnamed protein product [Arabidopsis arenosa]
MKGVKSLTSVFSKSSSTHPKRVFSAISQSENQRPPTPEDDDLIGPFIYPSNLGRRGNALKKKSEEEDDDDSSEKSQDDDDDADDKDSGSNTYGRDLYQHSGPFRGSPILLPRHPSSVYISGGATIGKGKGPYGDGNEQQGQSSNHGGVCNGCSLCGCSGCKGCSGDYRNCPGSGRSGGN